MSSDPRPRWSVMRIWSLVAASLLTLSLAAWLVASYSYTGRAHNHPLVLLLGMTAATWWMSYIAAHVRDTSAVHHVVDRLDDLEERLAEYGDRREIAGQMVAAKAAANGRGSRLIPIE